jgi:hypothetical protein
MASMFDFLDYVRLLSFLPSNIGQPQDWRVASSLIGSSSRCLFES